MTTTPISKYNGLATPSPHTLQQRIIRRVHIFHLILTLSALFSTGRVKQIGIERPREMPARLVEFLIP